MFLRIGFTFERCVIFNCIIFVILTVLTTVNGYKHCNSLEDCGLGGGCVRENGKATCDCSPTGKVFIKDEYGNCSRLVKNCETETQEKGYEICANSGKCFDTFGTFYCQCKKGCFGIVCAKCYSVKSGIVKIII